MIKNRFLLSLFLILLLGRMGLAENIDPEDKGRKFAYGENIGWLNFATKTPPGVHVSKDRLRGFVWAQNIGWINLSPQKHGGVTNDGLGNLSGYAWSENVGWINFSPTTKTAPSDQGVKIDSQGNFSGRAWGENIGWITFDPKKQYNVQACKVSLPQLADLASQWLINTDNRNFAQLAEYWLDYCPDNTPHVKE